MKIALLTPTFLKHSGIDRVVQKEAEELAVKNKVAVFTFKAEIEPTNYRVYELGMPSNRTMESVYRLFFFMDVLKIAKVTKQLRDYDKIVCFFYPMTILGTIANRYYGKEYVYYNHGVAYPRLFRSFLERTYMRMLNLFTNFTVKNADSAISVSKFLRDELKRETGIESEVKYNKVDKKTFNKKTNKKKITAIIRKHRLKRPVLLFVGRIVPHKGIDLLIKAFIIVKEKFPEATLLIVGKHTFDGHSKRLKQMRSGAVFTGFVSDKDLPHYFRSCDLYVTASRWEGFDIPAVEAQMCGKKVVAFKTGSHSEVVRKGTLVKNGDVKAFAKAIIKNLAKKKGKNQKIKR